jgi:hypothetical protein
LRLRSPRDTPLPLPMNVLLLRGTPSPKRIRGRSYVTHRHAERVSMPRHSPASRPLAVRDAGHAHPARRWTAAAPSRLRGVLPGSRGLGGGACACPPAGAAGGRRVGQIPANAAHAFRNAAGVPARLLCTVAPRAWRGTSPSSVILSPPVPPRPRRSATPSARSGCGEPSPLRRSTASRSCSRPRGRRGAIAGGEARPNGAVPNACGRAPARAGRPEP